MDHQIAVCISHGIADFTDQLTSLLHPRTARLAPVIDRQTLNVVHHDVRTAIGCGAAVEQPGAIGMIQSRQNAAFPSEPFHYGGGIHAALDDLDGDACRNLPVRANGQVHHRHAAAPQFPLDPPGAQQGTFERFVGQNAARSVPHGVPNIGFTGVVAQEGINFIPEFLVSLRLLLNEPSLLLYRQLGGCHEKVFHLYPPLLAEGTSQRATLLKYFKRYPKRGLESVDSISRCKA